MHGVSHRMVRLGIRFFLLFWLSLVLLSSCTGDEEQLLDAGEEKAARAAVYKLDTLLNLDNAQKKAVYELALQGAQQIAQYRAQASEMGMAEKAKVVNGMTASFEAELREILTPEQWTLFQEDKARRKSKKVQKLKEKFSKGALKPIPAKPVE